MPPSVRSQSPALKKKYSSRWKRFPKPDTPGEATQQDVFKAQAEISMLKPRMLEFEQQQTALKAKLNLLLDRPADSPLGLAVTEPQPGSMPTEQSICQGQKDSSQIKRRRRKSNATRRT